LNTSSIEPIKRAIWQTLEAKFAGQRENLDLLRYYSMEALNSFREGAYEESFLWGYQMICEKTIVDPKSLVSDKRDGKPESFSEIRTILMHSRRKGTKIDVGTIKETKRMLPQFCVEILLRDFELLERLTSAHYTAPDSIQD
jgi:hypothetical protein